MKGTQSTEGDGYRVHPVHICFQHHKLSLMHQDVYLSGNRCGIGCSKRVLQQISSEGKQLLRLDESCLLSLIRGVFRGGAQGARAPPSVGHAQNQVQPKL